MVTGRTTPENAKKPLVFAKKAGKYKSPSNTIGQKNRRNAQ